MAQDMTLRDADHAEHHEGLEPSAFARRLANLLRARRELLGAGLRELARRSGGRFTARDLREAEAGTLLVDDGTALELAALYGVDLAEILGDRLPIQVEAAGLVRTGGVVERFDPTDDDSLLTAYLHLVRTLRRQERADAVDLRRDDVLVLAAHLGVPGTTVVERLAALMGATRARRTSMAALFGAGVAVIGLTTGVAAVATSGGGGDAPVAPPAAAEVVVTPVEVAPAVVPDPVEQVAPTVPDVAPPTTEVRDAHVPVNIVPAPAPADEPVAPEPPVATAPPSATAPPPTAPPPTAAPAPTTVPDDQVGLPPVPSVTAPPPEDTLIPGTSVVVDPPPPVVPVEDGVPNG